MASGYIVIHCREPKCQNVQILHRDSRLPVSGEWTCQVCEDALDEQMTAELARREEHVRQVVRLFNSFGVDNPNNWDQAEIDRRLGR